MAMSPTRTFFQGRREFYRGPIEFSIDAGARDELASRMMTEGVHPAAEAIARACNAASSWGGYNAVLNDQVARIYGLNAGSSERGRRLLAAVDMVQP